MSTIYGTNYDSPIRVEELRGKRFVRCTFVNSEIPSIVGCKFDLCVFKSCKVIYSSQRIGVTALTGAFTSSPNNQFLCSDSSFYGCEFTDCGMLRARISNVSFLGCTFRGFDIANCFFSGKLIVWGCRELPSLRVSADNEFSDDFSEAIDSRGTTPWRRLLSWGAIRFLANLPIPKIGFSGLAIVLLLLPIYNFLVAKLCNIIKVPSVVADCSQAFIDIGRDRGLLLTFFAIVVFLVASLLHLASEPPVLGAFRRIDWEKRGDSSVLVWDTLSYSNRRMLATVLLLYCSSSIVLMLLYFLKFYPLLYLG